MGAIAIAIEAGSWCCRRCTGGGGALALVRRAPLGLGLCLSPLAIVRGAGRGMRRGFVTLALALPLGAPIAATVVVDARAVVAMVAEPGIGRERADAEPDETGGTAEHVVAPKVVVPVHVVVWHMIWMRDSCSSSRERWGCPSWLMGVTGLPTDFYSMGVRGNAAPGRVGSSCPSDAEGLGGQIRGAVRTRN